MVGGLKTMMKSHYFQKAYVTRHAIKLIWTWILFYENQID